MKSQFFTDTQGLDAAPLPSDKVCVCLLMNREAYELAVQNASRLHLTSGEYLTQLIRSTAVSACGTKALPPKDNPWQRFPPAPPGR